MPREFKRLRPGDELTCVAINAIYDELDRLRKMTCSGTVIINDADSATSPPVFIGVGFGDGLLPALFPTGMAAGSYTSPSSKSDVILLVESGSGYSTTGAPAAVTVTNPYSTAVSGTNKFGYIRQRSDNSYEFVLADC